MTQEERGEMGVRAKKMIQQKVSLPNMIENFRNTCLHILSAQTSTTDACFQNGGHVMLRKLKGHE